MSSTISETEIELAGLVIDLHGALARLLRDINELAAQSEGVLGLHLNGDVATWDELLPGGRYEDWIGVSVAKGNDVLAKYQQKMRK